MTASCTTSDWDVLLGYRLGELDPPVEGALEDHLFACDACTRRLEAVEALGAGVRELVEAGAVAGGVTEDLLRTAADRGLRLRTYRLAEGEEVACTAAPEDDFVVVRLAVPARKPERVDVTLHGHLLPTGERSTERMDDVFLDPHAGEVVMLLPGEAIRALPRSRWRYEVRVHTDAGPEEAGPFLLDHTPWEERQSGNRDTPER